MISPRRSRQGAGASGYALVCCRLAASAATHSLLFSDRTAAESVPEQVISEEPEGSLRAEVVAYEHLRGEFPLRRNRRGSP